MQYLRFCTVMKYLFLNIIRASMCLHLCGPYSDMILRPRRDQGYGDISLFVLDGGLASCMSLHRDWGSIR